jgi:N-acetylglucosaminyldiphosphoundecaprenol N-acetyl-beta-D-mannosaminyltransferase
MLSRPERRDHTNFRQSPGPRLVHIDGKRPESDREASLASATAASPGARPSLPDDLAREVYCLLGVPVDAIEMDAVLRRIECAASSRTTFFISAPNLNSLVISRSDHVFKESLILSDVSTADGMAVVWIARLTGIPLKGRIAGSDIFDVLKARHSSAHPLKIFLFGGPEGIAEVASQVLNREPSGVRCVGWIYPGFCSAEEMSRDDIIDQINSSGADFLVASLGNRKGQLWLLRNHDRLSVPVRAHLGATLNFQAGTVQRAPTVMRKLGLEWLWRIKEEPHLWRRYRNDGWVLLRLLLTDVLLFILLTWWSRLRHVRKDFSLTEVHGHETVTLSLSGPADARHVDEVVTVVREAIATKKKLVLDFSSAGYVDARFLGSLLMLKKTLNNHGAAPTFVGLSAALKKIFRLNGLDFA